MKTTFIPVAWMLCWGLTAADPLPLTESIFTEIIQEAHVVTATNKTGTPAKTNDLFKVPDLVRTGQSSRVELTAKDQTITRVGANTTFTFAEGGRDLLLKKGSVLFHSPAGAGGGSIKYHGSSAAVLGTTEIGAVLADGRFKVLDLEGSVEVTLANGLSIKLKPGQMVIVSADGTGFGPVIDFDLGELASHLLLVVGFSQPLSSRSLIEAAIERQNQQISDGLVSISMSWGDVGVGLDITILQMNDSQYYVDFFNSVWNPLNFPGHGNVGPPPGTAGGSLLLPIYIPMVYPSVINPPLVTDPNPPIH